MLLIACISGVTQNLLRQKSTGSASEEGFSGRGTGRDKDEIIDKGGMVGNPIYMVSYFPELFSECRSDRFSSTDTVRRIQILTLLRNAMLSSPFC